MTKNDIINTYEIKNDRIISPGMFERENIYIPYFWDLYLQGYADSDIDNILTFDIQTEDIEMFPELKHTKQVQLYQRDDGFVCEL